MRGLTLTAKALVLLLLVTPAAFATNGYFVHGQGTLSKTMAGAGVALPREALDAAGNPAAAAFIPSGYSAGLSLFSPDRQYSINGVPSGYPQTFGLTPGTVTSESKLFPMPSLAINLRPSDRAGVSISAVAHGGMNTDYRTSTFYGSNHTGVDLGQMFLTASYGRKIFRDHAVGISVIGVAQRFKASGLEAFGAFSRDAESLTGNGYDLSYGAGLQVGYLGYLTPEVSIGASYMPQVNMSSLDKYRGLFADGGSFDIPSSFTAGAAWRATDAVTFAADYQRIHYSDVRAVGNHLFPNLGVAELGGESGAGFGWDDINVYKVGVDWAVNPDWSVRTGYSVCDQPIPDSEVLFNILAPGVIERHITFGISKALAASPGRINLGVMYAPSRTVRGANPLEAPGQQEIELKMNEWEAEISYTVGF